MLASNEGASVRDVLRLVVDTAALQKYEDCAQCVLLESCAGHRQILRRHFPA